MPNYVGVYVYLGHDTLPYPHILPEMHCQLFNGRSPRFVAVVLIWLQLPPIPVSQYSNNGFPPPFLCPSLSSLCVGGLAIQLAGRSQIIYGLRFLCHFLLSIRQVTKLAEANLGVINLCSLHTILLETSALEHK